MYSKFPLSLERLPRPRGCGCFSLRAGSLLTSIVNILYSVLMLSVVLGAVDGRRDGSPWVSWSVFILVVACHATAIALSALLLVGSLREKAWMIRPWVIFKSLQLGAAILMFIVDTALRMADVDFAILPYILGRFLTIVIWTYLLVVVTSYLRDLEETAEETVRLKQLDEDNWYTSV